MSDTAPAASAATPAITGLAERQRAAFHTGATRDVDFRIALLRRLRNAVTDAEPQIIAALQSDLGKPWLEAYGGEIAMFLGECDKTIAHLRRWARPKRVGTPLLVPGSSFIHPEPYGTVLVIAPWNYPFQLALIPAMGAIAAGNHVVIKPSELAPATSRVIADLIGSHFDADYVVAVEGGIAETQELLGQNWDYLFYTGNSRVGQIVMTAAAEHLTPLTLEMGGKNPCIVTANADIRAAAKRIVWGKFFNAGQTCIAPDFVLVHRSVKAQLVEELAACVKRFYGDAPSQSPDYGRIINDAHLQRLTALLEGANCVVGGQSDAEARYLAPTIVDAVAWTDPLMAEEIFGPVLPIVTYDDLDAALAEVVARPYPLSLYVFSRDRREQERVVALQAGAVTVNDVVIHFQNANLPFGGIGESGMGAYHGRSTFDTFSHHKAVLRRRSWPRLLGVRFPPYRLPQWLIRLSLKWFA